MDPNEVLRKAREAFQEGNDAEAAMYYRALDCWLHVGGFPPDWKA